MTEKKEKKCPSCGITSKTFDEIKTIFGFRNMKDKYGRITVKTQSFCRKCRTDHSKNKPTIKQEPSEKRITSPKPKKQYNFNMKEFTDDWNYGMSFVELAAKYNLSYAEKVKKLGLELGLKKQKNRTYFDKFLKDPKKTTEFVRMYNDESIKILEIASHFGFVDKGYVSRLVKKIGISPRVGYRNSGEFEECKNEFTKMWNENIHVKTMMQKLDISRATINLWRDKLGLQPRTPGMHKEDSVANKVEQLLIENSGALTTTEIKKYLNREQIQLGEYYKSKTFQRVSLTLHKTGRSRRAPTDYFGDDTGQSIVYLYGMHDCLILKLSKILQKGNAFKNNMLKSGYYNFMINRLAEFENEIKKRSNQLHIATHNQQIQNELEDLVKSELKKYKIKHESNDKIVRYESNNPIIQDILKDMPKSKFYGRKFNVESVIKELDSSYPEQQKRIIQEVFAPFNFICKSLDNNYFDLEIISNSSFLVKLMIHQKINESNFKIFQNNLRGMRGFIVNLEPLSQNIIEIINKNNGILGRSELSELLTSIEFLPIRSNSFAKITFGENKDKIVFCEKVDFETNTATIIDDNKTNTILMKFLKQIEIPKNIAHHDFLDFIKKLESISSTEKISSLDELGVNIISYKKRNSFCLIDSKIDSNRTRISIPLNLSDINIENTPHITSAGFLRNILIQCDCLAWISQEQASLCKHSIALLFNLWKNYTEKSNEFFEKNDIENFINYIHFLIRYSIKLEEFWINEMDSKTYNKNLIHHAILNLISNKNLKHDYTQYDENSLDKSELENLMVKFMNQERELFNAIINLSIDQKKMLTNTLLYQYKDKQRSMN